jgi:hypothetical protein
MKDNSELVLLEKIEGNFKELNTKVLDFWKIIGILILIFFILLGSIFCQNLVHVFLLIIGVSILGGLWYVFALKNAWKLQSDFNTIRIINEFGPFRTLMKDKILVETFKIRLDNSEFRGKMHELEILFNNIETLEYKILLGELMKERGISFNDGSREERSIWEEFFRLGKQEQNNGLSTDIERDLR